jgi:hypothetical protein
MLIDPLVFEELEILIDEISSKEGEIRVECVSSCFQFFELIGPNSLKILFQSLKKNYEIDKELTQFDAINIPKSLPNNLMIDLRISKKRENAINLEKKAESNLSEVYASIIKEYCQSDQNNKKMNKMMSEIQRINGLRSTLLNEIEDKAESEKKILDVFEINSEIPIMILNSCKSRINSSFYKIGTTTVKAIDNWNSIKVLTISGIGAKLLINLKNNGAKPIGLKERNFVLSQNMRNQFPRDFPGSVEFLRRQLYKVSSRFLKYSKLCQRKRKNYKQFHIRSPFNIDPSLYRKESKLLKMINQKISPKISSAC